MGELFGLQPGGEIARMRLRGGGAGAGEVGLEGIIFDIGEGFDEVVGDEVGGAVGLIDGGVDVGAGEMVVEVGTAGGEDGGGAVEDGDDGFEALGLGGEVALGITGEVDGAGVGHGVMREGFGDFKVEEFAAQWRQGGRAEVSRARPALGERADRSVMRRASR